MNNQRVVPALLLMSAAVILALVTLLPAAVPQPGASQRPGTSPSLPDVSSGATPSPTPRPTPLPDLQDPTTYVGPSYDLNLITAPTAPSSQARLWYNDGAWWAVLVAEGTTQQTIHELDWGSQHWVDTGVIVDERPFSRIEALWDGTDLNIVGSGPRNSESNAMRVLRFTYVAESRTYVLAPDYPRTLIAHGSEPVVMTEAGDGSLWMAFVSEQRVHVMHTTADGAIWLPEYALAVPEARSAADQATIVTSSAGVTVLWTNRDDDDLYAAEHLDTDPDDAWTVRSVPIGGLTYGDDRLSARSLSDGTLLAVVRTSFDAVTNVNLDAPLLVLARLRGDDWTTSVVSRVRDSHDGPYLMVDDELDLVHVFADAGRQVYRKTAPIDSLIFSPGLGVSAMKAVDPADLPPTDPTPAASPSPSAEPGPPPALRSVTATMQGVSGLGEIVLLASNDVNGRYEHAVLGLPGGREAPVASGHLVPPPADLPGGLRPGETTFLVRNGFTAFVPGPAAATGWTTRDEPPDEVVTIAEPTPGDLALRLVPDALGSGPRACRSFPSATTGIVIVRAAVQARGVPDSDSVITSLRSASVEFASVRFGEPGTFRYFDGDERVTTTVPYQAGVWYASVLTLDLDAQTYAWSIGPVDASPVLEVADRPLRTAAASADEVCVEGSNELPGGSVELLIDDFSVEIGPGG